jgi:SHS2 domain-containing protein
MPASVLPAPRDPDTIIERERRDVEVQGPDDVHLLERWLQELLFLTETERLLFTRFDVTVEAGVLRATAHGEPIDQDRHELRGDIKGVTRHMTDVTESRGGYEVRVLVDM